jgi:hypothetical protein
LGVQDPSTTELELLMINRVEELARSSR